MTPSDQEASFTGPGQIDNGQVTHLALSLGGKRLSTSADNPGVVVLPPFLYGGGFILVLLLHWIWPLPIVGHAVALRSGVAFLILAVTIAVWGRKTMHATGTNISPLKPDNAIVTSGPFRFTRNPLHSCHDAPMSRP